MVYGEKRISTSFSLDHVDERELYQLARTMTKSKEFSTWVKKNLKKELIKRKQQSTESSITYRAEG